MRFDMGSKFGAFLSALVAGGLLSMQPVTGQAQAPTAPQQSTAPGKISDDKLDAAAAAVKKVAALSDKYEQQLAQAPDEKKDGVVREANDELTKAVTEQGLSVEE